MPEVNILFTGNTIFDDAVPSKCSRHCTEKQLFKFFIYVKVCQNHKDFVPILFYYPDLGN